MAARDPARRARISAIAAAARWAHDPEHVQAARHDLATDALTEFLLNTVEKFGPFTTAQRSRLAVLLNADQHEGLRRKPLHRNGNGGAVDHD